MLIVKTRNWSSAINVTAKRSLNENADQRTLEYYSIVKVSFVGKTLINVSDGRKEIFIITLKKFC